MIEALSGAIAVITASIAIIFYQSWKTLEDRLFLYFSAAFILFAIERVILVATDPLGELRPYVYLVRFFAFSLIIYSILAKNLSSPKG